MNKLVISIGSNSIDKEQQVSNSILWLHNNFPSTIFSETYSSQATNGIDPDYLNAVAIAHSEEQYDRLVEKFKAYEISCGRTKNSKTKGEIPIDLDIVIWNDKILRQKDFGQKHFQIGWKQIKKSK